MSEDAQEKKKRIDLSMSQIAGGGLATLTAATAASYLGVYGTIIGAAVMSVISTVGTAVAQHYLKRSGDQARVLAERAHLVPGGPNAPMTATGELRVSGPGTVTDADTLLAATTETGATDLDDHTRTRALPVLGTDVTGATDTTRAIPEPDADDPQDGPGPLPAAKWKSPRSMILAAVAVFLVVMAVIFTFELVSGRSLGDTVRGRDGASAPSLLGGAPATEPADPGEQESGPRPDAVESSPEPVAPEPSTDPQDGTTDDSTTGPVDPTGPAPDEPGEPTAQPEPGSEGGQDGGDQEPGAPAPAPGGQGEQGTPP
ncbi:hypothetical protein Nans01_33990 [Nocardiopsis ansamitocini]|uniref:Uncharacterized protein n=2 Tax=Nocardiopsis ansamitocini TaxID=1670832 RepID=A0A9W6P8Q9_9ACTN|nr:hypothetical protein Nans01_33990 [Nocardiopsis ansamitocini]